MKRSLNPSRAELSAPFLRWAGSKQQLLPTLSLYWDESYDRYVEPFAGSASWFFYLSPKSALLGDINKDLISTYRQVKNHVEDVIDALSIMKIGERHYRHWRNMLPANLTRTTRAARFIYLNRFCFNGLYRTNRSGTFNVPYNGGTGTLPSGDMLQRASRSLKAAILLAGSFETTLEQTGPGDFVYMDPPFNVRARRTFNEYDASVFTPRQLRLLRDWMRRLDRNNVPFLVSYAHSDEGDFLSKGFFKKTVSVRRNIAGFASHRRQANEVLISNVQAGEMEN